MTGPSETIFTVGARAGSECSGGDQAAESAAATGGSDQQMMPAKGAQTGDVGDVLVRPAAQQAFFIEIVGGGSDCGTVIDFVQLLGQHGVYGRDQLIGCQVGFGPTPGGKGPGRLVGLAQFAHKG